MSSGSLMPLSTGSSVTVHGGTDPVACDEFGYGLGPPSGILVLRYRAGAVLELGESRQDFLHQLYWSPDATLAVSVGDQVWYLDHGAGLWAHRGVSHRVRAVRGQTLFRVCLREVPERLRERRSAVVDIDPEVGRLIRRVGAPGCPEADALAARGGIMAGLRRSALDRSGTAAAGAGAAATVAAALASDPADPTRLDEWATRLHVSRKTLQRDFVRSFGMPYTAWRSRLRLRAAYALLAQHPVTEVAHRVGYTTASAFVAAFTREYGFTPGRRAIRSAPPLPPGSDLAQ